MTIGARARSGCLIPGLLHNTKIYRRYQPALREPDTLAARLRDGLDLARRLTRIRAASTGGVRACICHLAGYATDRLPGHVGAQANPKLTSNPDHSVGADHSGHGFGLRHQQAQRGFLLS
jgi:hypothetical protein